MICMYMVEVVPIPATFNTVLLNLLSLLHAPFADIALLYRAFS